MSSPAMNHYYRLLLQIASHRFPDLVEELELSRGLTFPPLSFRKENRSQVNKTESEQQHFAKILSTKKPIF